ncbi:thioredoxin [Kytococcus sedentarius]|uniref:thioredoxin n=1 Tax=Kytococcus sedentarius TaxID=1276 RepID=UPI0035BC3335
MAGTETTTDATFDQDVLKSELPVLVDFWADWCGPCKRVAPILEEIAKDAEGKLRIVKLNTDENPQTAARYGITSIPTMHVFFQGDVAKTIIGAQPKPKLLKELEPFLG